MKQWGNKIYVMLLFHANERIANRVAHEERLAGMGTTAVVTAINGNQLYWASVGDSRFVCI